MSNAPAAAEELPTEEIDLTEANEIIDKYLTLPGNLMPVLQGIQDAYGYVPKPTIGLVAERLNTYPAQIFMGDAGSLAIGGTIATLSVLLKQEALFVILGGLFIAEAFTSQFQEKVGVRWLGRRLFDRAPLHHNMQHHGLAETKVVVRLWIVAGILALLAVATIKLR